MKKLLMFIAFLPLISLNIFAEYNQEKSNRVFFITNLCQELSESISKKDSETLNCLLSACITDEDRYKNIEVILQKKYFDYCIASATRIIDKDYQQAKNVKKKNEEELSIPHEIEDNEITAKPISEKEQQQ